MKLPHLYIGSFDLEVKGLNKDGVVVRKGLNGGLKLDFVGSNNAFPVHRISLVICGKKSRDRKLSLPLTDITSPRGYMSLRQGGGPKRREDLGDPSWWPDVFGN